jgi:hypothetical protein
VGIERSIQKQPFRTGEEKLMGHQCPHCSTTNPPDARFCESCGESFPETDVSRPRVVSGSDVASTETGRSLQADQLKQQSRKAAGALLAVAILQVIFGTFMYLVARNEVANNPELTVDRAAIGTVYGVGGLFFALYLWARKNPLPAAIVGLVIFVSLHLLDAVLDPTAIARGIIVKIIIIVVLIKAIQAGVRHRTISREASPS